MRVLHIIDSLGLGGAERLLVDVITGLPQFEHHVITISDKQDLASALPEAVHISSLGFRSKKDIPNARTKIRRYIQDNKIDLVHSHLTMANVLARLGTPRSVPLFNSLHSQAGVRFFSSRWSLPTIIEKWTYRSHHHILAVSETVLRDYDRYIGIKGPATVMLNFVSDRFFSAAPHNWQPGRPLRMIAVGSLKPAKNYAFLVKACKNLPAGCSLDIYGDGPLKEELSELIRKEAPAVRLCGPRADVENLLKEYDVFVMSSTVEGHPVALVEAMAAGLPAIMSDIPVLREATGGEGIYFSLEDPESFKRTVDKIMDGTISLNEFAEYNHQFAHKTARKENYMARLVSLYGQALAGKSVQEVRQ